MTWVTLGAVAVVLAGCGGSNGPSAETSRELRASLAEYRDYLRENAEKLTHWTGTIVLKVKEGSAPKAQSRFAAAQVPRGHLEPAAQRLDDDLDENFLRIEREIFGAERTAGAVAAAKQLWADADSLQRRLGASEPRPAALLAGARATLEDIVGADLTGRAEPYSDAELTVVAAELEGVDAAIAAGAPLLREEDPELLREIEARLRKAYAAIGEYGILAREPEQSRPQEPGIAFVVFSELDQAAIDELARPIRQLSSVVGEGASELDG